MVIDNNIENESQGLTASQVEDSRNSYGMNILTPPHKTSMWRLYLEKYKDPIIQILLVAAVISLIMACVENDYVETVGIFLAIFFATTVGFYFERDAAKKFNLLTKMDDVQNVKVKRDGHVMEIPRKDVVVGDLILVEVGDEVPADARLISSNNLQINESGLTGEPLSDKNANNHDDLNSAYPVDVILRSTMVMNGHGEAIVTAVGDQTEIGRVAKDSTEETDVVTPLNKQLNKLAALISKVGTVIAIAVFAIFLTHDILTQSVWHSADYFKMTEVVLKYFMMAVTLIVMAVPEGLPMAVTLSLALNMRRMLKSNNLVRRLHACETMGAVTVICTDKTGTLTQNRMTVVSPDPTESNDDFDTNLYYAAIALNSTAELDGDSVIGNPTEGALLMWMNSKGVDYRKYRHEGAIESSVPFSTERKYMETTAVFDGKRHIFLKGAPEIVIGMCEITDEERNIANQQLLSYQHKAMRTLAVATDHKLQAIVGISDPIRKDVPDAVRQCHDAGIDVKVVTGDTAATAIEISRQVGVFDGDHISDISDPAIISGSEWAALSDDEALERAGMIMVMSRARPSDKQRLVTMLQKRGEVVAVTGDGTNDAPALHYAHVGLSLGSGTNVAKDASDMTLLDDSFGSIVNAVMWGRSLYKNIQRFLFFQLTVNVTALLLVLGGSFVGTAMPLTVTQILWVNLIMDTFAAMALASLSPSQEVMTEKPRK
ncbi:MAG: calcium-translocating P-type ATPase, PMCA-type, partial [Prevotella sp.]